MRESPARRDDEFRRPGTAPFHIAVPPDVLHDLRLRLDRTEWPRLVASEPWSDGTDAAFMRKLVSHWRSGFDWRAQEQAMNALPQFLATIHGARIHFVHVRGRGPHPTPIVLTNGWPSTFLEYRRLIPLLTDPARYGGDPEDAFDVVIPSLPGFGFSDRPDAPGMNVEWIATLWAELMTGALGYERFFAHGSDIGAGVTSLLGFVAPDRLLGIHLTSVAGSSVVRWLGDGAAPLTEAETRFQSEIGQWSEAEGAYSHLQRTKPRTLAFALADSPVGLAAWIVEKYRAWSDCHGDVEQRFSLDELLTTITLYWVTGSIGSSMRLYFEGRLHPKRLSAGERVEIPCAAAIFPHDIARPPREWGERAYRITRWTEMPRGGHFPAHEEPELLAADLRDFVRDLRPR
jgi:pimeloyl-ACP methyl ester carboxylesterase